MITAMTALILILVPYDHCHDSSNSNISNSMQNVIITDVFKMYNNLTRFFSLPVLILRCSSILQSLSSTPGSTSSVFSSFSLVGTAICVWGPCRLITLDTIKWEEKKTQFVQIPLPCKIKNLEMVNWPYLERFFLWKYRWLGLFFFKYMMIGIIFEVPVYDWYCF